MRSVRWMWVLGFVGTSGCGGIPIVSGEPRALEAGAQSDVNGNLGRDAAFADGSDFDALEVSDASDLDQLTVDPLDAPRFDVARPEDSLLDAGSASDVEPGIDGTTTDDRGPTCAACVPASARGEVCCGVECRNLQTDKLNCGACGFVCPGTNECVSGRCVPARCPAGTVVCAGLCADLAADPGHCGSCTNVCPSDQACVAGMCRCPGSRTNCGGQCVNTAIDARFCGRCDISCVLGFSCVAGVCLPSSCTVAGETNCGGRCFNLLNDPGHCGGCASVCAAGELCVVGVCACPLGQTRCAGVCTSLDTETNCSMCGLACPPGQRCDLRRCVATCVTGEVFCGADCTNVSSDVLNCGDCGNRCALGQACLSGGCTAPIDAGAPDAGVPDVGGIDAGAPDVNPCTAGGSYCGGFCVDTNVSPSNCGGCNRACPLSQNCLGGVCMVTPTTDIGAVCLPGRVSCNGFCVDTLVDPANCGGCNIVCPGTSNCFAGICLADGGVE